MKTKMIIILISSIAVFGIFLLPIAIYADAAPTSWSQVGNTINSNYTSAQCNFTSTGTVNIVLGMANGTIGYWNGTAWTEMQPGSQITSGGTNNGSSVTALYCSWNDSKSYPDVLAGYSNGDVQYLNASTLKWSDLGAANTNQQVTKFGGVSIDSSNNITGCNAETATVPSTAVTPVDYTNKQLWTYNGTNWSMLLQNPGTTCIDADMSLGNGVSGLSNSDIQQNGSYDANVSSNPISSVAYLGQNNGQNEYFYASNDPSHDNPNGNECYGIGYFTGNNAFSSQTCWGYGGANYEYTAISPVANGDQSVMTANGALQLFNITNNYSSVNSVNPFWIAPSGVAFNGLYVNWNGTTPQTVIAGLTNGQLVVGNGIGSAYYQVYSAPSNFPSNGEGCSQTFASTSNGNVVELFNNDNSCYVYTTNFSFPGLSTQASYSSTVIFPSDQYGTKYMPVISLYSNGGCPPYTYTFAPSLIAWNQGVNTSTTCNFPDSIRGGYCGTASISGNVFTVGEFLYGGLPENTTVAILPIIVTDSIGDTASINVYLSWEWSNN